MLNFKKLPYKTVWVEYPDIEKLSKEIGVEPTMIRKDGRPLYTLPAIQDPNTNTAVSESYRIAEYLEKTYPNSPKLFPPDSQGLQAAFYEFHVDTISSVFPMWILKMVHGILQQPSQAYFWRTKQEMYEKKWEEFDSGVEEQWESYKAAHSKLAACYDKNGGGHFIQGDGLTYADINIAGFFAWYRRSTDEESEEWKKMLTWDNGKWARLMEALKPYESVDL